MSKHTGRQFTMIIEEAQYEALVAIKDRDGISLSEQVRRAIDAWIAQKEEQHRLLSATAGKSRRKAVA